MFDKYWQHAPRSPSCTPFLLLISQLIICCLLIWLLRTCSVVYDAVAEDLSVLPISKFTENTTEKLCPSDETTLIDLDNFRFTINHDPCSETSPLLLILVHSAAHNLRKRNVIRETWGSPRSDVIVLFGLGWSDRYRDEIIEENNKYMDIIQGNFMDTYRNLTYKYVMLLKWVTYRCTNAKNVLKVDDDVFVNIPEMIRFLKPGLSPRVPSKSLMCHVRIGAYPHRERTSKWWVTVDEYPATRFPTYCSGWTILYSLDSIPLLYHAAQKEPYFWIDDAHVTGTVAKKVGITHIPFSSWMLPTQTMNELLAPKPKYLFGPQDLNESQIKGLHNLNVCPTL